MLLTRARLQAGEVVLVLGGGSGVGQAAIQIARLHGARVIATAGTDEKLARARALGAFEAVNHTSDDIAAEVRRLTNGRGVDIVVEHVGTATWDRSVRSLARGGRLVTCGATTGHDARIDLRFLFSRQLSLLGSYMGRKGELLRAARVPVQRRTDAGRGQGLSAGRGGRGASPSRSARRFRENRPHRDQNLRRSPSSVDESCGILDRAGRASDGCPRSSASPASSASASAWSAWSGSLPCHRRCHGVAAPDGSSNRRRISGFRRGQPTCTLARRLDLRRAQAVAEVLAERGPVRSRTWVLGLESDLSPVPADPSLQLPVRGNCRR